MLLLKLVRKSQLEDHIKKWHDYIKDHVGVVWDYIQAKCNLYWWMERSGGLIWSCCPYNPQEKTITKKKNKKQMEI